MSETLHRGLNSFDEHLKNVFDNYHHTPNTHIWGKLKFKLIRKDVADFASFKKLKHSFKPQAKVASMHIKVWATYAAAASLTVGFVYGAGYYVNNNLMSSDTNTQNTGNVSSNIHALGVESTLLNNRPTISIPKKANNNTTPTITSGKNKSISQNTNNTTTNQISNVVIDNSNQKMANNNQSIPITNKTETSVSKSNVVKLMNYIKKLNPTNSTINQQTSTQNSDNLTTDATVVLPNIQEDITNSVTDNQVYNLEIPNVFTPNGDGYNDVFVVINLDKYPENSLIVADRNGKIVFDKNNYQNNWDAQNIPDGSYYYILSYKDKNNNKGLIKGQLTIFRK
ncbi:MAG: gliding motility-associated C-terminal domain-containing protein [Bacteroidota bacterium]